MTNLWVLCLCVALAQRARGSGIGIDGNGTTSQLLTTQINDIPVVTTARYINTNEVESDGVKHDLKSNENSTDAVISIDTSTESNKLLKQNDAENVYGNLSEESLDDFMDKDTLEALAESNNFFRDIGFSDDEIMEDFSDSNAEDIIGDRKYKKEETNCIPVHECFYYNTMYSEYMKTHDEHLKELLRKAVCDYYGPQEPKVKCPVDGSDNRVNETPAVHRATLIGLPQPPYCGKTSFGRKRIINGKKAFSGELPWMALVGHKSETGAVRWFGGGFLVTSRHVLTAAHLAFNKHINLIRLGKVTNDDSNVAAPDDYGVIRATPHDDYNSTTSRDDIAVLLLDKVVQFTEFIQPVCIPQPKHFKYKPKESALVAGWGWTGNSEMQDTLLKTQVYIKDIEICRRNYKRTFHIDVDVEKQVCASDKGTDACAGDSGGPLLQSLRLTFDGRVDYFFYAIGVVSYGPKVLNSCGSDDFPGVYTKVAAYGDWISKQVAEEYEPEVESTRINQSIKPPYISPARRRVADHPEEATNKYALDAYPSIQKNVISAIDNVLEYMRLTKHPIGRNDIIMVRRLKMWKKKIEVDLDDDVEMNLSLDT